MDTESAKCRYVLFTIQDKGKMIAKIVKNIWRKNSGFIPGDLQEMGHMDV